jgi:hypothetical protein
MDYGPQLPSATPVIPTSVHPTLSTACVDDNHLASSPTLSTACVDDNHLASTTSWGTTDTFDAGRFIHHLHDVSFPHPLPHLAPFAMAHSTTSLVLEDTLPFMSTQTIPVTILGLSLAAKPSSNPAPCNNTMADSGANVCLTFDPTLLVNIVDITPIPLGVALQQSDPTFLYCHRKGDLPIPLLNGTFHYQPFLLNEHATDTILSPIHIMKSSDKFRARSQSGDKDDPTKNRLIFRGVDGQPLLDLPLTARNGLQYCSHSPTPAVCSSIIYGAHQASTSGPAQTTAPTPDTTVDAAGVQCVLEAELWSACLGYCGEWQLKVTPQHSLGTPTKFYPHPLRFVDHKEHARIRKRAAGRTLVPAILPGQRFGMDFRFMRASTADYRKPDTTKDRVVESFDGYAAYLLIVDEATKYIWVFLRQSKILPTDLVSHFLQMYGRKSGGVIRCDQGGELA